MAANFGQNSQNDLYSAGWRFKTIAILLFLFKKKYSMAIL